MSSRSFAARAGRWSAAHRKAAIFGWLAFVAYLPRRMQRLARIVHEPSLEAR